MSALKPATRADLRLICGTINDLRSVRDRLNSAGAVKSADYVRRALKSAEGAKRHVERRLHATPLLDTCPSNAGCYPCTRHDDDDPCCLTHCDDCQKGVC